ncbi:Laminin subunit beta-1 [Bagarius yarrelli]|uniref:Laminin subunit beta-1 n=1 Tax=Bagarius yarrelli TaxID=175774 RepID=A0A556U4C6_BAGYA|nr:Laminin subunit beta-1 [Bagarius yarrelli]
MASWFTDDRFTADENDWKWVCGLGSQELRNSYRSSNPILLREFDLWEKSLLKSRHLTKALSVVEEQKKQLSRSLQEILVVHICKTSEYGYRIQLINLICTKSAKLELELKDLAGQRGLYSAMCELHSELTEVKNQATTTAEYLVMKKELHSAKEANQRLSAELATATERLQETLQKLHELEAEKLIQTSQIAALETERLQLIGEKEELMDVFDQGDHKELKELKERNCKLRELQEIFEYEKTELEAHCQCLEKKAENTEAECRLKEQELKLMKEKMEQEKEELKGVAAHWNERWLDVAMTLQSTQTQLEEAKKQQQETDGLRKKAAEMTTKLEKLEAEMKDRQNLIQSLQEEKTHYEQELTRIKKEAGALKRVELDACRQQLELERNRSQTLQHRLMENPVSQEQMDGELVQLKAELQNAWDMVKTRDTKLAEQQQELQSVCGQVTQQNNEIQRLEQQLANIYQELKQRDILLKDLMRQGDTKKTEAQIFKKEAMGERRSPLVKQKDSIDPDHQRRLITEQVYHIIAGVKLQLVARIGLLTGPPKNSESGFPLGQASNLRSICSIIFQ